MSTAIHQLNAEFETACRRGNLKDFKNLLNVIPNQEDRFSLVNKSVLRYSTPPPMYTVWNGHFSMFSYLIDNNLVNFERTDETGNTYLHIAALKGDFNFINKLLNLDQANILIYRKDYMGKTAFELAEERNRMKIATMIRSINYSKKLHCNLLKQLKGNLFDIQFNVE